MINFAGLWMHECHLWNQGAWFDWLYRTQMWYFTNGMYQQWMGIMSQYAFWLMQRGLGPTHLLMEQQYVMWLQYNGLIPEWGSIPAPPVGSSAPVSPQAINYVQSSVTETEPQWKKNFDNDVHKEMYQTPTIAESAYKTAWKEDQWK